MNPGMISASVTMGQLQKKINTIGHNLANLNTYGYKSREVQFSNLLFREVDNLSDDNRENNGERVTPDGIRVGYGAKIGETNLNLQRGAIQQTGRTLDVALLNPYQFFQIDTADGEGNRRTYTRNGAFYLQPDAANQGLLNLVTQDGDFVVGTNGRGIQIPTDYQSISIDQSGRVEVSLESGEQLLAGRLAIVNILKPQLLESVGGNQLAFPNLQDLNLTEADVLSPVAADEADVRQEALEASNVDLGNEMTELLNAQRAYQFNARAISIADQSMQVINSIR
ncbi:MAG TPA: flagellar hook-basal body protein [Bacillales bacterium]|nr:flagellar hook-basal body protein [Bacillales bacterium]